MLKTALQPGGPLAALTEYKQFITWRRTDKMPVDPATGRNSDGQNPSTWMPAAEALQASEATGHGVGFVFTPHDPFYFVDIDKALNAGQWSPVANELCQTLTGAAVEVSQSGTGLHIIGKAAHVPHSCKNIPLGIEYYTEGRYCALTGSSAVGDASIENSAAMASVATKYFPPAEYAEAEEWRDEPVEDWSGPEDDDDLIARACRATSSAASIFGTGVTFKDLFECDEDALSKAWPDVYGSRAYDASSADASLAQRLAFWTGKNHERMREIMLKSALNRDKWESHGSYLTRTITQAVNKQDNVYSQTHRAKPAQPAASDEPKTDMYCLAPEQVGLFKGYHYVQDDNVILTPYGSKLDSARFNATYGGRIYSMDAQSEKTTTKAFEVFTESRAVKFSKVASTCFRPDTEPGEVITLLGSKLVNTYRELPVDRRVGDVTPFTNHLKKLLPNTRDRQQLTAYMAAIVQHKGYKFKWAPLVQGVEGNGKSILSTCVAQAVGMPYVHFVDPGDMDNKFNSWLAGNIFIPVEDINAAGKVDLIESLKPKITEAYAAIQPKGKDPRTVQICCNFIFNSNHKDAIRKNKNDRRFAMFYTAQQEFEDLARDGMTAEYFDELHNWLNIDGGHAFVAEYLYTLPIPPEMNPARLCQRAPMTSSTTEAIRSSAGMVEHEIGEAIAEGRPGFRNGWISSIQLGNFLKEIRAERKVPLNKRGDMLKLMGYVPHPSLRAGRSTRVVPMDGGKSRLFIKSNHKDAREGLDGGEVVEIYETAQGLPAPVK